MELLIGEYSGFCAGVQNTYNKAIKELNEGPLYCLGLLVHNEEVVNYLKNLGMIFIDKIEQVPDGERLIFRAHGETIESYEYVKNHHIKLIDLTCNKVKTIHQKVSNEQDSFIIVIGKKTHPEIIGTKSFCKKDSFILETKEDFNNLCIDFLKSKKEKIYIVSQTTFSSKLFDLYVEIIKKLFPNVPVKVDKTICNATEIRQKEVKELSQKGTKVLVIGSKTSSNTQELYRIAISNNQNTYFIENENDASKIDFKDKDIIAVVAGASVPKYLIEKIINKIKSSKVKERILK